MNEDVSSDQVMHLLDLLAQLLRTGDDVTRASLIREFQGEVWDSSHKIGPRELDDALGNLAHDMAFFESDPNVRKEDISYFGERELFQRIRDTLRSAEALGVRSTE